MTSRRFPLWVCAISLSGLALPLCAAPVDAAAEADPHELALRWTLASLSPLPWQATAPVVPAVPASPVPRTTPLPQGGHLGTVPDPSAYALMGALLLGAGLVGRRFTSSRKSCRPRPPARG